jgi:non-ribosomal peptide synthetase component F
MKLGLQGDPGRNPLFDFVFGTQNIDIPEIEIPGLKLKPYKKEGEQTRFDLLVHAAEAGDTINMRMNYSGQLFKPLTIKKIGERFIEILAQVVQSKEIQLQDISLSQELVDVTPEVLREELGDFEF